MERQQIKAKALEVLASLNPNLDASTVTEETSLINDLGLDSLDLYELLIEIEKEFHIELNEHTIYELETIGKMIDCLVEIINNKK